MLLALGAAPASADSEPEAPAPAVVALDAAGAGVDDFEFASFDALYELSRDDSGRSLLRTVETLVAVFPDFDQNRGIRRALVSDYKGHGTALEVVAVTDGDGNPREFHTSTDGDFTVLTIAVPEGRYVYGEQTYVIEYTQRDVTSTATDTTDGVTRDEFYWDTNGTGWAQPFGTVSATVRVTPDLVPALTGEAFCYVGAAGATRECPIDSAGDGEFTASATGLLAFENLTVTISFREGTFSAAPFWAYVPVLAIVAFALILFAIVFALIVRLVLWRDAPGRGIVVAQYEPPTGVSALVAANLLDRPKRGMAAAIVDLAVRKNVRIVERTSGRRTEFGVQQLSPAGLARDEERVIDALFSTTPPAAAARLRGMTAAMRAGFDVGGAGRVRQEGEVRWLTKNDTALGQRVLALTKATEREVEAAGLRRKPSRKPLLVVLGLLALAGLLLGAQLMFLSAGNAADGITTVGLFVLPWVAILSIAALVRRRPRTPKGSEVREHLEGLREFIRVAEADRLRMLQSVTGAERVGGAGGPTIVKIYERLLPYAVLFDLEKQWASELAKYYDTDPPDWYSGSAGFSGAAFASGIGSLSSSVTASYSSSSSSSSSGGGGGGGSSGGGGGGGGGGGV